MEYVWQVYFQISSLKCSFASAAWKIIKAWLPAAGVKKIRFLTKATMGEYVDDQNRFEVSLSSV